MNDTLKFILVCVASVAGIILLTMLLERFVCKSRRSLRSTRSITVIAMCGALSGLLMLLEIPMLFIAPEFYKIDFGDLPALLCSMYLGPTAGVLAELLKVGVKLLLKGTSTAFVGDFANFLIGCTLIVPASVIYHLRKSKKTAVIGLLSGSVLMTVFGSFFNAFYLLPAFSQLFGLPLESIISMGASINGGIQSLSTFVLLAVAPVNLIKATLLSLLTLLLYKRLVVALRLEADKPQTE